MRGQIAFLDECFQASKKKMSSQILVTVLEFEAEMEVNVTADDAAN